MAESGEQNQSSPSQHLWYCVKCTRMINPPGSEGIVTPEGEHLCANCAPAKRSASVRLKTGESPSGSSKPVLKPAQSAASAGAGATSKSNALRPAASQSAEKTLPVGAVVCVVGAAILVVGLIVAFSGKPPERETAAAPKPAIAPAPKSEPDSSTTNAPMVRKPGESAAVPGTQSPVGTSAARPAGPSFLQGMDRSSAAPVAAAVPADSAPKGAAQPAATESSLPQFQEELKKALQSDEKGRYGVALQQLKDLSKRFEAAQWWDDNKAQVGKAEQDAQQHLADYGAEAEDARKRVRESDKLDALAKVETTWKTRLEALTAAGQPMDELVAQSARGVLKVVAERRAQIAEQKRQAAAVEVAKQVEVLERQTRATGFNREASRKTLDDIEALALDAGVIDVNLAERFAALHFDVAASHEADLAFIKVPVKTSGSTVDIQYDFSSPEQLGGWLFDEGIDASVDAAKRALTIKHPCDKHNPRDTRMIRLPFDCFQAGQWSVEVDVSLVSNKNKLEYGMLVLDGAGNVVRLAVWQRTVKDIAIDLNGKVPGKGDIKQRDRLVSGNTKDPLHLRLSCQGGMVSGSGLDMANGRSGASEAEKLGFEPKFLALYIQVRDKEEDSSAVFSKLKITGQLNLPKMRANVCAATRKDYELYRPLFKDWLILGPFKAGEASPWEKGRILDVATMLALPATNTPAWQRPFSTGAYGPVDLLPLLKPNQDVYAYAAAEVEAEKDTDGQLWLGSDDGVVVWLDGNEIHRNPGPRGVKPDEDKVAVKLSAGVHSLVFRVDQVKGDAGMCARLVSADGKGPLPGVQLRCATRK